MNEIRYNLLTNEIISQNIPESIVKGQSDNIKIKLYFEGGDFDYTWDVRNVFTRADDEKSNNISAIAKDGYFELTIRGWMSDVVGELKVATRILIDGSEYKAFDQATLIVQEGELPSSDTILDVQYDGLLDGINNKVAQSQYDSEMNGKVNKSGDTMTGPLGMGGNPIKDVDDAVDPQDAVTKKQLDVVVDETIRLDTIKADKATTYTITETNNLLAGKLDIEPDGSAKVDMPASIKNRNVVNVGYLIQEIFNENIIVDGKLLLKVDKLTQIAGLPIGDGITMNALVNQLRTATDNDKGLMSAVDKGRLDTLYQILTDNEESWVDTIHEILEILENYPEGTNLAGVLHDLRQDITALETANFLRKLNGIEPDQDGFIVINSTHIDNLSSIAAIDNKKINTVLDILWNKFDNYYLKGETYSTQEIDNLLDQLKAVYGWTDTHIGDFVANSDSFSNMLDYDYLILSASVSGEYLSRLVNTATIKPNDTFILDGLTLTATSNDNGTLTFTSGTGTVSLYGVKMEQQKSENITYEDTNVKDELDRIRGVGEYQLIRDTNGDVVEITDGVNKTEIIRDSDKRVIEIEETFGTEKYKTTIEKNENGNVVKIKKEKVN